MKRAASCAWLALIMLWVLASPGMAQASAAVTTRDYSFDLSSAYGSRDKLDFTVSESGCVLAQIKSWSRLGTSGPAAGQLALILNGSNRTGYYARMDGSASSAAPLWVSYAVTTTQLSRVRTWTISVINFTKSGTAQGTINLEYPPTLMPCELKLAPSRTQGQIDINWSYTGRPIRGSFLIEHSTNGTQWSSVNACKKSTPTVATTATSYSCSDTGLRSGVTYYYRACTITSGSKCGTVDLTPAMSLKAP